MARRSKVVEKMRAIFGILIGLFLATGVCIIPAAQAASWSFVDGGSLSSDANAFPQMPVTAVHDGALYVAWYESLSSPPGIRIRNYNGMSWSAVTTVVQNGQLVEGAKTENISINQIRPALASYGGNLYAAYAEYNDFWGNSRIHVKKFNGSTWSNANNNRYNVDNMNNGTTGVAVNPYPCSTINVTFNANATNPTLLAAANGKLYVAWTEIGVVGNTFTNHYNIRVAALDTSVDSDWRMIDGGGGTGLNYDTNKDAVQSVTPCMAWFNGKLYVGWVEANVRSELRVKEYNPATGSWAFVDGGSATGLNYDPPSPIDPINRDALTPLLATFNGSLYAIWSESTYNDPTWGPVNGLRYKKFNGTGWSDDGSTDGGSLLNYLKANPAIEPVGAVNNKTLYLAWNESAEVPSGSGNYFMQLRAAGFDGATRSFVDGNGSTGLNAVTTRDTNQGQLAVFNDDLYAIWHEMTGYPDYQDWIRVKKLPLPPYITSVSVPANGTYKIGDNLDFTLHFNKAVTVDGSPYLPVTLDSGGTKRAYCFSGAGSKDLVFRYTVQSGNLDGTGITVGTGLIANGGTLRDADADDADLALNSVPSTASVLVDGVPPTISIGPPSPTSTNSGPVTYTVTYSGASSVNLTNAKVNMIGTGTAHGTLSVANGTTNTPTVTLSSLTGDGTLGIVIISGSATDAAGNSAPQSDQSTTFIVDNTAPAAAIAYSPAGPYKAGDPVTITATFSEAIADSPAPKIALSGANTLSATAMTRTNATHYTYSHTVGSGSGTATITLSTGTDLVGNTVIAAPTSGSTFVIVPAPTVTGICPASGLTAGGTVVTITGTDLTGATSVRFGSTMPPAIRQLGHPDHRHCTGGEHRHG